MLISTYHKEYLDAILSFDGSPKNIDLKNENNWLYKGNSFCVFSEGILVGYLLAINVNDYINIEKIGYKNKQVLSMMLSNLFINSWYNKYRANLSPESLRQIIEIFGDAINVDCIEKEGGNFQWVKFTIYKEKLDLFFHLIGRLYKNYSFDNVISLERVFYILNELKIEMNEIQKMEKQILEYVNQNNLDYYNMFDKIVPAKLLYYKNFYNKNALAGYRKKLLQAGVPEYRVDEANDDYFKVCENNVIIQQIKTTYQKPKYNNLSGARYFFNWLLKKNKNKNILLYDKYGLEKEIKRIPYCTEKIWDYEYHFLMLKKDLDSGYNFYGDSLNQPSYNLRNLSRLIGINYAVQSLSRIMKHSGEKNDNYIHDWNVLIRSLMKCPELLTKGAIVKCLSGTYNAALKKVEVIKFIFDNFHHLSSKIDKVKDVRQIVSKLIRTDGDIDSYAKEISGIIQAKQAAKYEFSKKTTDKLNIFLCRMSKYKKNIDVVSFVKAFGKETAKRILNEDIKGIFEAKVYSNAPRRLSHDVLGFLKSRTKSACHVYNSLKQHELLESVRLGTLDQEQCQIVKTILKQHNYIINKEIENELEFYAKVEPKCSPEYLIAGDASVCCMGFGENKAITYATEEGFGILNVYYKKRVVANSVLWIDDLHNYLVIDNIEVHPNYMKLHDHIKDIYETVLNDLMETFNTRCVVQGSNYNDIELYGEESVQIDLTQKKARGVKSPYFYSDANKSFIVYKNKGLLDLVA